MARIRTIKPEAFESEDLASVSVTAERTFFGLLTLADDSGRFRDHPAIIAGRLWALRAEHTAAHVARDLEQLSTAGLICRYTGCDGRTYLHIVTWERHQKIDRPSASRLPRCPQHPAGHKCGGCAAEHCPPTQRSTTSPTSSPSPRRILDKPSSNPRGVVDQVVSPGFLPADESGDVAAEPDSPSGEESAGHPDRPGGTPEETTGQTPLAGDSPKPPRVLVEGSSSGSRILDPGSVPTGREAPVPAAPAGSVSAKDLVAEYARGCNRRPPSDTLGLLGRKIKVLLEERFEPEDIRTALDRLRTKGLHPSVLPSLVNEVVNASPRQGASPPPSAAGAGPWASTGSAYTPYLNPTAPTTFGGRL
jgi:hypothetical protein